MLTKSAKVYLLNIGGNMKKKESLVDKIKVFKNRSAHWRKAHFECSRHYQRCEFIIGIFSVVLSVVILGFAFYGVDRPDAPRWIQYVLAILVILLGAINAVQLYLRPAALTDIHRDIAASFGQMHRKWEVLEITYAKEPNLVTLEKIQEMMEIGDEIARKSRSIPYHIFKKYDLPS